jgi:NhaP-type Na+/H+ or K+/H+ antiporter
VAVISLTVLLSVLLHGFTAVPLANRFAPRTPTPRMEHRTGRVEQ